MFHIIYSAYKSSEIGYWKMMEIDEPCLECVPCMPETMVQEYPVLNRNALLGTGTYYMPVGLSINRKRVSPLPKRIYPGAYGTPGRRQESMGASTPYENTWWPPGRISSISCTIFVWPP